MFEIENLGRYKRFVHDVYRDGSKKIQTETIEQYFDELAKMEESSLIFHLRFLGIKKSANYTAEQVIRYLATLGEENLLALPLEGLRKNLMEKLEEQDDAIKNDDVCVTPIVEGINYSETEKTIMVRVPYKFTFGTCSFVALHGVQPIAGKVTFPERPLVYTHLLQNNIAGFRENYQNLDVAFLGQLYEISQELVPHFEQDARFLQIDPNIILIDMRNSLEDTHILWKEEKTNIYSVNTFSGHTKEWVWAWKVPNEDILNKARLVIQLQGHTPKF